MLINNRISVEDFYKLVEFPVQWWFKSNVEPFPSKNNPSIDQVFSDPIF